MELFSMEEFLGSSWAPEQTFDCFHFDDVKGIEADDGLLELSIKSETLADTPLEMLQDLSPTSHEGSLDMEWMEQSNLMQLLDVPLVEMSIPDTAVQLGEDFIPSSIQLVKPEPDTHESVSVDEFLQNLLKSPEGPAPIVKTEAAPSSPEAQVAPEIKLAAEDGTGLEPVLDCQFLQSPLSSDDVESVLSSACSPAHTSLPASPSSSILTVDAACLFSEDDSRSLCSTDLYKVVENTGKARSTPYSRPQKQKSDSVSKSSKSKGRKQTASISPCPSELELELMSKKDRKKLQNKNAAIRYRMKKKIESDQKQSEVDDLESVNLKLREKFEELTREVQYMKDLIDDVRKAQGLPSIIHKQVS